VDLGAEGIDLIWTWPDVLPVSVNGWDIQRLSVEDVGVQTSARTSALT
jgi:hypothetical protein